MIMFTIYSGLVFLIGLLSFVYGIPVTTTEVPIDESGGKYANFKESKGPILGQGGFGRVIKMINPTNERDVVAAKCVKLVNSDSIQDIREERDKYLLVNRKGNQDVDEGIHGVLIIGNHPNVVRMLAYQAKAGESRFFFELYDGSLKQKYNDKIRRMPVHTDDWPFTLRTVFTFCNIFTQLLDGLDFLHNINIIHRDIHMSNIMISSDPDSKIVLIDFGLSTFDNGQLDRKILDQLHLYYTSAELDAAVKTAGSFNVIHKPKDDIIAALIVVSEYTTGIVPARALCDQIKLNYEQSHNNRHAAARQWTYNAFRGQLSDLCEMKKNTAYVEQAIKKLEELFPDQHEKIVQLTHAIGNLDRFGSHELITGLNFTAIAAVNTPTYSNGLRINPICSREAKTNLHNSLKEKVRNVKEINWGSNMKMDFIPETLQQSNSHPNHPKERQKAIKNTKTTRPRSKSQPSRQKPQHK